MTRQEIEQAALKKAFAIWGQGPAMQVMANFAIEIANRALDQALLTARDDVRTPNSVLDAIAALKIK